MNKTFLSAFFSELMLIMFWQGIGFGQAPDIPSWPRHTIDASSQGADGVKLADINRDGRMDIVTGWEEGNITKLYLHPGNAKVKEEWPGVIVGQTPQVEDAVFADVNNDGRLDIVSCSEGKSKKILVHFGPKKRLLRARKWKQEVLPASDGKMMWMYALPHQVDEQFGEDLIAAGKGENAQLGWFEAGVPADELNVWKWHPISAVGWVMSMLLRDMDQDGDMDIVITDRYGPQQGCRWLEHPDKAFRLRLPWKSHMIGAEGLEVMFMSMADLDGDRQEEVVVAERSLQSIRIFRRCIDCLTGWAEQAIPLPSHTGKAKSVEIGDLNGDKIKDLVISTNTYKKEINGLIWLDGKRIHQTKAVDFQPISGAHHAKYDKVELIDMDGDEDLDILICEENYGELSQGLGVIWFENNLSQE